MSPSTRHLLYSGLLLLLLSSCSPVRPQPPYDLLITGGSVLNGDGTPAVTADIGVRDGKIARIGKARGGDSAEVLFDVLIDEKGSVPTVFVHH